MISLFKNTSLPDYSLHPQRIDVWQYSLVQEIPEKNSPLNKEERFRASRFYFPHHRRRFIAAHTVLRLLLSRYCEAPAHSLEFIYNTYGKPQLKQNPSLHFNLSHSGDLALLAVGQIHPLGIDLEYFSSRPYDGIGKHIFSSQENHELTQLTTCIKPLGFFHLWVQKEAFIKACGLGLSYPTKQFNVSIHPPSHDLIQDPLSKRVWRISSFMPHIACPAALCYHPGVQEVQYHLLEKVEDLYEKAD